MLDLVQDLNGNTMTISYMQDGNYFYPTEIIYAGHAPSGAAGTNKVKFEYDEGRNDQTISYGLGVEQRRRKLLRRVSSFAGPSLVRRYELSYQDSPTTHRPLLTAVDLVGADDTSRIRTRTYSYQAAGVGFGSATSGAFPIAFLDSSGRDIEIPKTALVIYASAVNGDFTTASFTGADTGLPDWVGLVFTLSGIAIPAGAAIFGAQAAPQAETTVLNLAPSLL